MLHETGEKYTYGQLEEMVLALSAGLAKLGVNKGVVVQMFGKLILDLYVSLCYIQEKMRRWRFGYRYQTRTKISFLCKPYGKPQKDSHKKQMLGPSGPEFPIIAWSVLHAGGRLRHFIQMLLQISHVLCG